MYIPIFPLFSPSNHKIRENYKKLQGRHFMRYFQFFQFFVMLLSESIAMQLRFLQNLRELPNKDFSRNLPFFAVLCHVDDRVENQLQIKDHLKKKIAKNPNVDWVGPSQPSLSLLYTADTTNFRLFANFPIFFKNFPIFVFFQVCLMYVC